jgi:Zn-dependent protease
MTGSSIRVGTVFGIEVRASRAWAFVILIVAFLMASNYRELHPTWSSSQLITAGAVTSALFVLSVVLHELAHCVVARAFGIQPKSITLTFFGGMSSLGRQARRPIEEFSYAIAGPGANIVLATVFLAVEFWLRDSSPITAAVLSSVGLINAILALFNLVPGFPLDGGRAMRAVIWWMTGSYEKGTVTAAVTGQIVAALLLMAGIATVLAGNLEGLMLGFAGLYLLGRARASLGEVAMRKALQGLTVQNLWLETLPQVERNTSLVEFLRQMPPSREGAPDPHFMVVDEGVIWGLIPVSRVTRIDPDRWTGLTVGDLMTPIDQVEKLSFQTDIVRALEAVAASDVNELPVVDANVVQGFVGRDALMRFVASRLASESG